MQRRHRTPRPTATPRRAFTLSELLVAILIISVLLAIGVGVGMKVMGAGDVGKTKSIMSIYMNAVERYREDSANTWPPTGSVTDSNDPTVLRANNRYMSNALVSNDKYQKMLTDLPSDAIENVADPADPIEYYLYDSYGNQMLFKPSGGLGGTPVLISIGPDATYNTDDDIRSDKD
jgi:prepilin-type N-terminal cleavage/methylation domain-containing protein